MKKLLSTLLACVILVGTLLTFVSCGESEYVLSGEYEGFLCNLKFSGEENVIATVTGINDGDAHGTYKITDKENGGKIINFTFSTEGNGVVLMVINSLLQPDLDFEKDGDKITIDSIFTFEKK